MENEAIISTLKVTSKTKQIKKTQTELFTRGSQYPQFKSF